MENQEKNKLTPEELANIEGDKLVEENSKNKGSSEIDTRIHQERKNYGRTTDSIGVGHEPGTTPGTGI